MKNIETHLEPVRDGAFLHFFRKGKIETKMRLGPNMVHAFITRRDGSIEDLGVSHNLLTNAGRDLWDNSFGHAPHKVGTSTSASTATTLTDTAMAATVNAYTGWRVFQPITGLTTPLQYANIGSNTSTVLTTDQWWTAADGTASTFGAVGSVYYIYPSCCPRFMGLSTFASPAAGDTTLSGEITTGGCARSKSTYAHTAGTSSYTMQVVYSVTATFTAIATMGLFTAATATAGGVMVFETLLNQTATVGSGDTLTVTDTITTTG